MRSRPRVRPRNAGTGGGPATRTPAATRSPASALGNRATQRLLVQTSLRVGSRGDRYEREADHVAGEVMRSLAGGAPGGSFAAGVGVAGVGVAERAPAPRIQRMCAECAEGGQLCDECEDERGVPEVQRQERDGEPPESATPLLIPDDGPAPAPGQMRKGQFLAQLRTAVCAAADEELARAGRSSRGCPYLDYWFGRLEQREAGYVERILHQYAPETRGARSADEYVEPVVGRVRRGVAVWVETGQVTGVPEGSSAAPSTAAGSEDEAGPVQPKARAGTAPGAGDPAGMRTRLGAGRSLDGGIRARMEGAFGADFSRVRVHTDAAATQLSSGLHARAFTVGEHMAFDTGEYQPGTLVGDALIAHELAHVVQQGGTTPAVPGEPATAARVDRSAVTAHGGHDAFEGDADRSAFGAVASLWRGVSGALGRLARDAMPRLRSGPRLQRCTDDRPKYCPKGKRWATMPAPAGVGPVCICRWHCVTEPPAPYRDASGQEVTSIRCAGPNCPGIRYAGENEVVEGPEGNKKHSDQVESPTSTGVGAHFTPMSGENACGCIPPSDIAGAGATDAPLMQPGMEVTDLVPHAGGDIGRGTTTAELPPQRPQVVIEGPAVAGQKVGTRAAPVETSRPVEAGRPVEAARPVETAKPVVAAKPVEVAPPKAVPEKPATAEGGAPTKTPPAAAAAAAGGKPPTPLEQEPGARLVWGTRKSKIFHEEGSAHYEQMKNEKFPDDKGRVMTAAEAEAAGYRPAKTSESLEAARRGVAEHAMVKEAMRPFEGKTLENGWQILAVERTVGGTKRVDELWLDDGVQTGSGVKRIFVFDTYTGKVEPPEHYQKGWDYSKEPLIKKYIDQGYVYDYSVAIKHPEMLH